MIYYICRLYMYMLLSICYSINNMYIWYILSAYNISAFTFHSQHGRRNNTYSFKVNTYNKIKHRETFSRLGPHINIRVGPALFFSCRTPDIRYTSRPYIRSNPNQYNTYIWAIRVLTWNGGSIFFFYHKFFEYWFSNMSSDNFSNNMIFAGNFQGKISQSLKNVF